MVRSLLGAGPRIADTDPLALRAQSTTRLDGAGLQARLRQRRSAAYLAALHKLDAGGHLQDRSGTQALIDAIRQELPEVSVDALPVGIVARCHLGAPYEVHTLDCVGQIVTHYRSHEPLPGLLERARQLALHPGYAFVEVYANRLVAVSESGQTALIDFPPT